MSRGHAVGRVVRSRMKVMRRCLALSGKGTPATGALDEATVALTEAAEALRSPRLRGAHALPAGEIELRLHVPGPGARGGAGWTVLLPVPAWVGAWEAEAAIEEVGRLRPLARNIRLSPLETTMAAPTAAPGRDRQPGQIRRRKTGPQHRARELR